MERLVKYWIILALISVMVAAIALIPDVELPEEKYEHGSTYVLVNWYDTETELQAALEDDSLAGYSLCDHRPDFNTSFCELWLVLPQHSEDYYAFDTVGHEFCHALRGSDCHD